ncbi:MULTISPECIES: cell wall-binding repeat-containing protein [unclassified Clostridioides]|uniref:cell wall-binding repeat-containing protein n=1 Tax=unclassified Clostridioides TaxID=2635829 RepID=UPI001D128651|nr:cell wall-binding repeat-containing protein [Clostridioides sp. ZZV14-6154]MCC0717169.1 cell wall-binding repeat-containing protein [Clostridioides sp. ZZV14-6105]MCC0721054.1 cell wall-binding repeat-containing protein [Clostridioides sp. ZZV14-6104]MCC0725615.1 cell wall-binding repeat-containing protein [Clostridioides sp. ZZV14-6045]MCC0733236.1 cell wall-binding repeat-containing protein [Clostridioides sp. ZZV14-6009]MCC0737230.1 cell wall-binding repeat-containing protein [Clostridio
MKICKKLLTMGISFLLVISTFPIVSNALSSIDSINGKDKYETSAIIADRQNYTKAILINVDNSLADGLSASGLAGVENAPILLTKKDEIPDSTLKRLNNVKKVYIIGGNNSIGSKVENLLKEKNIDVERIEGKDRLSTSYKVSDKILELKGTSGNVLVANGFKGEADAISAASVAFKNEIPVLLTNGSDMPELKIKGDKIFAFGSTNTMSNQLVEKLGATRLGGIDRYETNKKIVQQFYGGAKEFYVASGSDLVYPLIGSTLAESKPIVLVGNGSNKSILKGATKITSIGNIDASIITQCLNVTNNVGDTNTGVVKNNTNEEYPLKGMLEQFGLNTTGKFGWDINYGGNENGNELRADGKYYYINKGYAGLGAYAAAFAGEPYKSVIFKNLDPIKIIAGKELLTYEQTKNELVVIRNFLNSFDWRNASDMEKANRAAKLVIESKYVSGIAHDTNVYGNLVEKRGSCGSFASSFHVLTRLMGMNSIYQEDGALNHAWNYVQIDGKWYEFDGSEVVLYRTSAEFNFSRLENATKTMPKYYDAKALSVLGFNQ